MQALGNGLYATKHYADALSVKVVELSMIRRVGYSEGDILIAQSNLAIVYGKLGRVEQALQIERDVYSGNLKLHGEEHKQTLIAEP